MPNMVATQTYLTSGDAAPHFRQRTSSNPRYVFGSAAGRYLVLCFFGSAADPAVHEKLATICARGDLLNDKHAAAFGVSFDPEDERNARVRDRLPGFRVFWDHDLTVGRLYGVVSGTAEADGRVRVLRQWVIIDPTMRIIDVIPFTSDLSDARRVIDLLDRLPPPDRHTGQEIMAPILLLPRVFEPDFCDTLIGLYQTHGGNESGFMREIDGKTVGVSDPLFKRRRDYMIEDETLRKAIQQRITRRVIPEIAKVHQFTVTRMERYIVSCYTAEDGGHFAPHRDNTTKGTQHRRFAVSINLNDDFEGGEVFFPEYGPRKFKAPKGAAVVFSCSLLHSVSKVTSGARFAFLPFVYDDAAARIREENLKYLAG